MYDDRRALRESEDRYRSVVTAMAEGVVLQGADSVIVACNEAAEHLLGLTADQMTGRTSLDPRWRAIHEDGSPFPGETHPSMVTLRTGQAQRDVVMGVHKPDGTLTWLSINSEPLFRFGEPRPYAAVSTFSDITHRKEIEGALRHSEERYRRILETTLEGVWMIDLEGNTTFANGRMAEMLGCTLDELRASRLWDFIDEADRAIVNDRLAQRARGIGELHDFRLRRKDGSHVWTSMATSAITQADGRKCALAMVRDVTDARRMEAELRQSKERLDLALSAGQMGAWEVIEDGTIITSPQFREIIGVTADSARLDRDAYVGAIHPDDRDEIVAKLRAYIASGSTDRFAHDYRVVRPDGELRWVRSSGRAFRDPAGTLHVLGILADITDARALEEQLQSARQLESIGRLAGGVAHDFNNLLTAILASVGFAEAAKLPGIADELATIRSAAERGAELTQQLLAFARKQVIQLASVDLDALLRKLANVLRRLVGEGIELSLELARDVWPVRAGATQIEQVIVNLAVNARDAMPDGGSLRVETRNVVVDAASAHAHLGVPAGAYATIAVTDSGGGIAPDVLPHIFEPFYTTKRTGTGLGLASAYGIAQQLGGHIRVLSAPGLGSTFTVYLPRSDGEAPVAAAPVASVPAPPASSTILIVEDDDLLKRVVVRGLVDAGYHVLSASNGDQALALAARHDGPIHALVTDVVMPRMSGRQLAERFAAARPETRILFVSGYNDQIIARQNIVDPSQHFLAKPYTLEALRERIDAMLAR